MEVWVWVWAALAAALIVGEIFTAGFFLLPFGLAAAVAAALAFAGAPLGWQWAAFLALAALLLLGLRRFSDKVTHEPPERMGADRLIGKRGVVIEAVEPGDGSGRVRIEREEWRADALGADVIPVDAHVVVEKIVGTHLVVRPADDHNQTEE